MGVLLEMALHPRILKDSDKILFCRLSGIHVDFQRHFRRCIPDLMAAKFHQEFKRRVIYLVEIGILSGARLWQDPDYFLSFFA